MKTVILIFTAIFLVNCGNSENQPNFSDKIDERFFDLSFSNDDEKFLKFYDKFKRAFGAVNETTKLKGPIIYFALDTTGWLEEKGLKGVYINYEGKHHIIIDYEYWQWPDLSNGPAVHRKREQIEVLTFHNLGHAILKRPDSEDPQSIMYKYHNEDMVLSPENKDELFLGQWQL